jgi:carbamoyl-phosphate synthase large subunit
VVNKVLEGRPHIVDLIKKDAITLIINTAEGRQAIRDSVTIRTSALERRVAYTTTMAGAMAILAAIPERAPGRVNRLQDLHEEPGDEQDTHDPERGTEAQR